MDGNGRWATLRGMARTDGHRAGTKNIRGTIEAFKRAGVEYLTLYAFSTENWNRPSGEVNALISLIDEVIRTEVQDLHRKGVRIRHIGSLDRLPKKLRKSIRQSIELTKHNSGLTLCVAFNYGARAELVSVVKRMLTDGVDPETVDEALFESYLHTAGVPDPDLIIRTAGEMRLSNFLLWQAAYAEFYSTPVFWPDFDATEVENALEAFRQRKRRFGRLCG
jgi:undecaprenyl diphosphate synthase